MSGHSTNLVNNHEELYSLLRILQKSLNMAVDIFEDGDTEFLRVQMVSDCKKLLDILTEGVKR